MTDNTSNTNVIAPSRAASISADCTSNKLFCTFLFQLSPIRMIDFIIDTPVNISPRYPFEWNARKNHLKWQLLRYWSQRSIGSEYLCSVISFSVFLFHSQRIIWFIGVFLFALIHWIPLFHYVYHAKRSLIYFSFILFCVRILFNFLAIGTAYVPISDISAGKKWFCFDISKSILSQSVRAGFFPIMQSHIVF